MGQYDRFIKTAKRLIAKYGEECQWLERVDSAKPDEPWLSGTDAPIAHTVRIAFFTRDSTGLETIARALDKSVTFGNVVGYMAAVNFKPDQTHTVIRTALGKTLTIESIEEVNINGSESILFTVNFTQ